MKEILPQLMSDSEMPALLHTPWSSAERKGKILYPYQEFSDESLIKRTVILPFSLF